MQIIVNVENDKQKNQLIDILNRFADHAELEAGMGLSGSEQDTNDELAELARTLAWRIEKDNK